MSALRQPMTTEGPGLGYRRGLDGLRGVAIGLVVFAHLAAGVRPHHRALLPSISSGGGFAGVQLFFVLSGFLITTLLVQEHERTGGVQLRAFYVRRARRLLPALFSVCAAFLLATAAFDPGRLVLAAGSTVRALLYVEDFGRLIPIAHDGWLGHTWSLAVEEQFYLLWPVLLLGAMAVGGRRSVAALGVVVVVATVAARVAVDDPHIAYTALRWDALALGCVLAAMRPRAPRPAVVAAAAVVMGWYTLHLEGGERGLEYLATAAASGVLVLAALESPRWLCGRALVHLGQISYGLYLWHVVVQRPGWHPLITIVLFIVLAELSYRFVEIPFRRRRPATTQADVSLPPVAVEAGRRPAA